MTRDIVLFLGAGFSSAAGHPTMNQFGEDSRRELDNLEQDSNIKKAGEDLLNAGRVFKEFQEYCRKYEKIDINNMETLFSLAEAMPNMGIELEDELRNCKNAKDLIRNVRVWLWKIFQRLPAINYEENKLHEYRKSPIREDLWFKRDTGIAIGNPKPYRKLFKLIKKENLSSRLTVITTNYDIVFEYFAFDNDIQCTYKVEKYEHESSKKKKKYFIVPDDNEKATLLLKLHGSINYFFQFEEKENGSHQRNDKISISKEVENGRPAILWLKSYSEIKKDNENLVPAIIPPTYSKLKGYEWLINIWREACEAIKDANTIIFIGYSFPQSDGFMQAFMQNAMIERNRNIKKELKIYVIDPGRLCEVKKSYKKVFGMVEYITLKYIRKTFKEAMNCELYEILSCLNGT